MAVLRKGIDVSAHQPNINWDKVKADGIQFAMLRLGVGGDHTSQDDKTFAYNVSECERVGIDWGAYLYSYALNLSDAKSELAHIRRLLTGRKPTYPIAFDMEDADGYKAKHGMPTNDMLVDICDLVLSGLEDAGYYATLYAGKAWLDHQLNSPKLDRYDKWVAQWNSSCTYSKPFGLWQYADNGVVNGIGGGVDMDYAYYDFPSIIAHKVAPVQPAPVVAPKPAPTTTTTTTVKPKSIDELAHDVINGKFGNGDSRKKALGSKYEAVQARVAELLAPPKPKKSIDELAHEVIAGTLGNGDARKKALGAQYDAVQARVAELLAPPKPKKTVHQLALDVIAGKLGNGDARKKALGSQYDAVQKEVARLMNK